MKTRTEKKKKREKLNIMSRKSRLKRQVWYIHSLNLLSVDMLTGAFCTTSLLFSVVTRSNFHFHVLLPRCFCARYSQRHRAKGEEAYSGRWCFERHFAKRKINGFIVIPRSKPGERRERVDIGGRERDRVHAHAQKLILWETVDCIRAIFTDHFFAHARCEYN